MPLIGERQTIGVFGVPRDEPIAFTDREIEIVKTFADQAVIAIENVRLFDEVQAKTRDLEESLAATDRDRRGAEGDQPNSLRSRHGARYAHLRRACICATRNLARSSAAMGTSTATRRAGWVSIHCTASTSRRRRSGPAGERCSGGSRRRIDGPDRRTPGTTRNTRKRRARIGDVRAMLGVPLVRNGEPIGAFALARERAGSFHANARSSWSRPSPTRR